MSDTPTTDGPRMTEGVSATPVTGSEQGLDSRMLEVQTATDRYLAMSPAELLADLDRSSTAKYQSMTADQLKADFDQASAALSLTIERGQAFVADIKAMKPLEQKQSMFSYLQGRLSALLGLSPKPVSDAIRRSDPLLRAADDRVRILTNLDQMDVPASAPLGTDTANTLPTLRLVFGADRVVPETPGVSGKDVEAVDQLTDRRSNISTGRAAAIVAMAGSVLGFGMVGTAVATGDGGNGDKYKDGKDKQYDEWCPEEPVPTTTVPVDTTTTSTTPPTTVPIDTTTSTTVVPATTVPETTPSTTVLTDNPPTSIVVVDVPPTPTTTVTWELPETASGAQQLVTDRSQAL